MKQYFLNVTEEERNNILDNHKSLYDGYSIRQAVPNQQPLYVQDFANDKDGVTVNSKGEVSKYNNKIYMKESSDTCKTCGMGKDKCKCNIKTEETCSECGMTEDTCVCNKEATEGIHDVQDINPDNKFDYTEMAEEFYNLEDNDQGIGEKPKIKKLKNPEKTAKRAAKKDIMRDPDFKDKDYYTDFPEIEDEEPNFDSELLNMETLKPKAKTQLKESLDMFNRFRKFN